MSTGKDGGPAFPRSSIGGVEGMTLRDWFAGQALTGLGAKIYGNGLCASDALRIAADAYAYADAMLAERES